MKFSLGLWLALCLAGLQFIAVTIVVLTSYWSSERVLLDHARNLLSDVGSNTIAHSKGFLNPAKGAAELAARLAENEIVSREDKSQLEQLLFQQLRTAPQFAGLFYGDQAGNFVYVMRSEDPGPFRSKIIARTETERATELKWRDADFRLIEQRADPEDTYDPRQRPWYKMATEARATIWTDPYIFFTAQSPGITIASPVIGADGDINGVIGVDIEISAISDFLAELEIGENGTALIINKNGDVIAHPTPDLLKARNADGTFDFVGINEIDDPIAKAAFGSLSGAAFEAVETEKIAQFSFKDAEYVSTMMPVISDQLPWTIAVYAPEADFTGAITANRTRDIWIATLVALVTAGVGLLLANLIHRPVRAFAVRAALISQGEIDPNDPVPKTYKELAKANDALTNEIVQRKNSEREYGLTFDLSSRGMAQITPDTGQIIRANERFAEIVGYRPEEIVGMSALQFLHPEDPALFSQQTSQVIEQGVANLERRLVRKDGESIWVQVNAIMIRDGNGKPLHAVTTIDDITRTKAADAQIEKLNRDLSHLARGKMLGQLAAGLAHELNQPLTAITQNVDAALMTADEAPVPQAELTNILKDLDQQAHRASDIIKALRNFARKGDEWKSPFDLVALVKQSMHLVKAEATENGIQIDLIAGHEPLPNAVGIRVQTAQVIVNLLRNAIEAIAESGNNERSISVTIENDDAHLQVSVADSGPGIDPNVRLFTQFETSKKEGMGLGLSICRSIVESAGGKLWHDAAYSGSTRFCFTIPVEMT